MLIHPKQGWDVALGMIPLTLLGVGAASVQDFATAREMLSQHEELAQAGLLEGDRVRIIDHAVHGRMKEAEVALREAWGRRSAEVAAEHQDKALAQVREMEQAQSDAVRLGFAPRITNDGTGYTLTLKNGTTVHAADWEEARQHAEEHFTDVEMQVVESVARMGEHFIGQKRAGAPEAFDTAMGEGRTLDDQVSDKALTEEQAADAAVVAGQLRGMTREESLAATWQVLGTNRTERRNNVRTLVSTVHRGGHVLTAVEEPIEGRWKAGLESGHYTREQGLLWVRLAEKATGQKFLADTDAVVLGSTDKAPRSLTEAISAIVTADVLGRRKDGTRLPAGLVTQGVNAAVRQATGAKERGEVVRFGQFLRAWRALFGQVFSRARALNKARAEGRLGESYEAFLDDLMGTGVEGEATGEQAAEDVTDNDTITETASRGEIDLATFGMVPKMRQDKPGSWEEVRPGHTWASSKRFLPKSKDSRPNSPLKRGSWDTLVKDLATWLNEKGSVTDPWNATVVLANPQRRGNFSDPLANRAAHLIGQDSTRSENRIIDYDKMSWVGAVPNTIAGAQVRATNGPETFYFRSYAEGVHMVVVEDGTVKDQYALVTQYAPELSSNRFKGVLVEQVRPVAGLAPQGGPGSVGIPAQPQSQAVQTPQPGAQGNTTTDEAGSQSMSLLPGPDTVLNSAQQPTEKPNTQEKTVFGEGRFPEVKWKDNADGSIRTKEEGVELAKKWGVVIPDDIHFEIVAEKSLGEDTFAQYGGVRGDPRRRITWKDMYTPLGIVVRLDERLLRSDEGLVGLIGHEMHELNRLRAMFEESGSMTLDTYLNLTSPDRDGKIHLEAWKVTDDLIIKMRNSQ